MDRPRPAQHTPLAIVGMSCLFPKADGLESFWANVKRGVDGITEIPASHWSPSDYFDADPKRPDFTYAQRGGFLSPVAFDPAEFGISPNTLEATDASQLLGLMVARNALKDAGYGGEVAFDRDRTSVILGVTGTLQLAIPLGARLGHPIWRKALAEAGIEGALQDEIVDRIAEGYVPWQENSFPGLLGNVVAGRIANRLDLGGTNCVVDAACASSLSAMHLAAMELASGKADMVVTGGVDTFNDIFMYMCFSKTPALSPTGDSRPFDGDGDGTILGEGLGMVVLKRLEDAERDGDRVYAVIRGIGTSSDGRGKAIYAPSADGQKKALLAAYAEAEVSPETIELLEAHGTGTKVGDATELSALQEVYAPHGEGETWCALGSVKSQIGHTKAAAGIAGLIKAALALEQKVLPPTIKVRQPLPALAAKDAPFYLTSAPKPWLERPAHPRRAAVSAFGFGGSNFHAVLEEHRSQKTRPDWDGAVLVAAFSGATAQAVETALARLSPEASWDDLRLAAASATAAFDAAHPHRLVLVIERNQTDLAALIQNARAQLKEGRASWQTPDGAFYGTGEAPGKLGVLFPGQGCQYVGMGRELACQFPHVLSALQAADAASGETRRGQRLSDRIYPPSAFDAAQNSAQETALRATDCAQPAIGAVSLGAYRVLADFGVRPDAAAGHSYGELTALAVAGRLSEEAFFRLSCLRGRLMAEGTGDRGTMLAVAAPIAEVEALVAKAGLDVVLANKNAPSQTVLSGATPAIAKAQAACEAAGMKAVPLPVAAAFHSPLVESAQGPFREALHTADFAPATLAVYANTTGALYPTEAEAARDMLAGQLASPVEFVTEITAMYEAGCRTFLEVGPGARMTGLVKAILEGRPHHALAIDASAGRRSGLADFARALAAIAALGHPVALARWEGGLERVAPLAGRKKPAMAVMLSGVNHRSSQKPRPPRPKAPVNPIAQAALQAAVPVTAAKAPSNGNGHHASGNGHGNGNGHHPVAAPVVQARPAAAPAAPVAPSGALAEALRASQESLAALQQMQAQTAQLHRQFLEGQETNQQAFKRLIEHQQQVFSQALGQAPRPVVSAPAPMAPAPRPAAPVAAPRPAAVAPVVVKPAPAPVAPPPTAPSGTGEAERALIAVVAEKTGYPAEMLSLEMEMEADLGIDSIKRVEILSAIQERLPQAPVLKPEHLGTIRTLGQIVEFLGAGAPAPAAPAARPDTDLMAVLMAVVAEKTGYPAEMLNAEMEMEADLGIDSIKRVEILSAIQEKLPQAPVLKPEHLGTIRTLGQIAEFLGAGTPAPAVPQAAAAPAIDAIGVLMAVVAEKTGYPAEMLNADMEMEADLGIDSIKRVEILSAVQEKLPGAPVVKPEHLGTLRTIRDVAGFLGAGAPAPEAAPAADATGTVLAVVAEKTGYPAEMLSVEMEMEADLGIDSIKRVEIMAAIQEALPDAPTVKPEHLGELRTLAQVIAFLSSTSPSPLVGEAAPVQGAGGGVSATASAITPPPAPERGSREVLSRQVLKAVPFAHAAERPLLPIDDGATVWIVDDGSALGAELLAELNSLGFEAGRLSIDGELPAIERLGALVVLAPAATIGSWSEADERFLKQAFGLVQHAGPALRRGHSALMTISRLDGAFGLRDASAIAPLTGGLAGLAKTAGHEWPEVACKAVDLAGDWLDAAEAARAIAIELLAEGPREVGLSAAGTVTLALVEEPLAPAGAPLGEGDVVVVTGGARGVTAETAIALAERHRPTLVLLGRTPEPGPEPNWLSGLEDEAAIKQALLAHAGAPLTPKALQERFHQTMADREIRGTLARITEAGSRVLYRAVDVRDAQAVARTLDAVRAEAGPIRGLIHGAGVLADRRIEDKTPAQLDMVMDTKVQGLRALLGAVEGDPLTVMVLFSSVTGRQGRVGQVDYAMANEVLNKVAQQQAATRPGCRVVSVNWGPWDGGMVTPALKRVFEAEGVGLVPLRAGAEYLVDEIGQPTGAAVEVLVMGKIGSPVPGPKSPVEKARKLRTAFTRELDLRHDRFLSSHVMNERAVLPVAVIVEWLAAGALHGNPGLSFHGVDDVRVFKGVVLDHAPYGLRVAASAPIKRDGVLLVEVELRGTDERDTLHARGTVVLGSRPLAAPGGLVVRPEVGPYDRAIASAYREVLFHGPHFQGLQSVEGLSEAGIIGTVAPAPAPAEWLSKPLRETWIADPLVLDAAFQLLILWSVAYAGAPCLPCHGGSYRQYREAFPESGVTVACRVIEHKGSRLIADIAFLDEEGRLVAELSGAESTIDASLVTAFKRNALAVVPS